MFGMVLNLEAKYFTTAPLKLLRVAVQFTRFSLHCQAGLMQQWKSLHPVLPRLLWFIGLPLGWAMYLRDRLRK
jgi:hypothetical protein